MPNTPVTWRSQVTVNTTTAGFQAEPNIIQLDNGNILVSWTSYDDTGAGGAPGTDVIGQLYDPLGNAIGGEFRLNNTFFADDEQDMELAALPGGGFISVFEDNSATGTSIRLNEYDADGDQVSGGNTVVSDASAADPIFRDPAVAVSSATSVLIVYEKLDGFPGIFGKIYDPTTNTYGAEIELILNAAGNDTRGADVAVLSNGNYVIAADRGAADDSIVFRIVDSAGANVLVSSFVSGTQTNTQDDRGATVTALTGGGFVIAWTNTDSADTDIEFRVFNNAGGQTGSGFAGNEGSTDNKNESKVIALADGSFVIAWDNDEAGSTGVDVQHFSAAGAALGSVFTVSAGDAHGISGVGLADGRFAVSWAKVGGEIQMEILDTRDAANDPAVYTPDKWQVGTVNADVFSTSATAEIIHGHDGADVITEVDVGTNVQIFGDAGNDTIVVTSIIGGDLWDGGAGSGDTINWAACNEFGATFDLAAGTVTDVNANVEVMVNFENLIGTANRDIVIGTSGANYLDGGSGGDDLYGGGGIDAMVGGVGSDLMFGGALGDTLLMDDYTNPAATIGNDTGHGDGGDDLLWGYGGNDTLYGGDNADALVGNDYGANVAGNDQLYGGDGTDTLFVGLGGSAFMDGGIGNDTFFGGLLADTLRGGTGKDFLYGDLGGDDFQFFQADFVSGDADIVYFVDAADDLLFSSSLNGDLTLTDTVLQYDSDPAHLVDSVIITVDLGGGLTSQIAVYGATVASLTPQIEYTL